MADTSPKKKVAAKLKKPAAHPKYSEMFGKAIAALKERGGSSRQAILKYIMANFRRCICHFSILILFQRCILFDERFDYNARLDN
jgi:hypothetical protein